MDRKQSQFTSVDALSESDFIPAFGQSTNKKISKPDLFKQIKDETQIFIYPTIEQLQSANLVADSDWPIYVRVEETGYRLYKITSLAAGANDIVLDNGAVATAQAEPDNVIENVAALSTFTPIAGQVYKLKEYHLGKGLGGGDVVGKIGSITPNNVTTFACAGLTYVERINTVINEYHAGAVGGGSTDDHPALQRLINYLIGINGSAKLSANNYYVSEPLVITGSYRTFLLEGAGTGNAQTASSGGTCIVTNGTYSPIVAEFLTFANENIRLKGIGFYNVAQDLVGGGSAIKIVRGASNGRYVSGFVFDDVFANGYAAMFNWQGMNTANALLNYFGNIRMISVNAQNCGIGILQNNCTLNLLTMMDCLFFTCPFGGFKLNRDGDVGSGNGKGSSVIASLFKCHMEAVGGMFRTQTTTTSDPTPTVLRSSISLYDFTHEACGATTGPTTGDPFQLGVDTDVYVFGHVVDGLSYLEDTLPTVRDTCTLTSESRMRAVVNAGGKIMSPAKINAPTIKQTIANGANYTFTIAHTDALAYAIKSTMLFAGGQSGFLQVMHTGIDSVGRTNTVVGSSIGAGITVTYPAGASTDVVSINVANATGFSLICSLSMENLSNSTIIQNDI